MNHEGDAPVDEAPQDRNRTVRAKAKIDDRCRQIRVRAHRQGGVEIPGRYDARARFPEKIFYVMRNQGFILNEKHELPRNQIQRHCIPLNLIGG
jgi:hypothetical protein